MHLLRTDLSNLTDTVFILVCSSLIELLLCFTQKCEKRRSLQNSEPEQSY